MEFSNTHIIADIPAHIFGSESWLASESLDRALSQTTITDNFWFQLSVALLALIYIAWLGFWSERRPFTQSPFRFLGSYTKEYSAKFASIPPSYTSYIRSSFIVGLITLALLALRQTKMVELPLGFGLHHIAMAVAMVPVVLWLYQWIAITLIGLLSYDKSIVEHILTIKGIIFSIFAIVVIPPILLYLLTDYNIAEYITYFIVIEIIAIALLYLIESFFLFVSKKVSILHWFLYLCGVELLPIATIWALISRI